MSSLLSISGVDKAFSGVVALTSASLEIAPGEVHALIGQNGAGKSTLIKILTGVYRRDDGDIRFDGRASTISSPREAQDGGISTIYQELNLVPLRSVTENVMMGYEPRGWGGLIKWGGVVVEEIEWRVVGDAEEHVLDGRERGGLAGLIGSEHDVDVRIVDRQPKRDVRESAVAEQIKPANPHGLLRFRRDPCRQIAAHLADQADVVAVDGSLQNGIF